MRTPNGWGAPPDGYRPALATWRAREGVTQRELAKIAKMSRSTICHLELGLYWPSARAWGLLRVGMEKVCGYGVTLEEIFPTHPATREATPVQQIGFRKVTPDA